jgi:hypothetical protein
VKLSLGVPALLAVCVVLGIGCAGADDVGSDETQASAGDAVEMEGDLASVEQAIITPVTEPGPAGQCFSACTRFSTVDITGACCICNNVAKKFVRGPTANTYLCR